MKSGTKVKSAHRVKSVTILNIPKNRIRTKHPKFNYEGPFPVVIVDLGEDGEITITPNRVYLNGNVAIWIEYPRGKKGRVGLQEVLTKQQVTDLRGVEIGPRSVKELAETISMSLMKKDLKKLGKK